MLAGAKEPERFWRAFCAGATASLVLPLLCAPLGDAALSGARSFHLTLIVGAVIAGLVMRLPPRALLDASLPAWAERALLAAGLAFFLGCQVTNFAALEVNGVDFSIFDWMIHNAHSGKGMFSPIYGVNHLGVHPTWLLYLWVPLHALVDSPWWLVVSNALVLWLGTFPLLQLARALALPRAVGFLAALAYLTNPWLGRLLDGGFRPESLYPVAGLFLALAWVKQKTGLLAVAAASYLAVKEDAALHLLGLAAGALLFDRARWRSAAGVGVAALAVLVFNVGWLQPALLAPYGVRQPTYVGFWGQYGQTLPSIAGAMLTSPWRVLSGIATSSWFKFFLPALGLPLLARVPLAAMAPVIFLLGTSGNVVMHDYRTYYPLPLLAFALWGLLEVAKRWNLAAAGALVLFPLFGGGYATLAWPTQRNSFAPELAGLRQRVEQSPELVCTQTILFPQLGYRANLVELSPDCLADARSVAVLHPELTPWPHSRAQLQAWISAARATGRLEALPGGYQVIRSGSGHVAADGEPGGHGQQQ
jgi:Predicted membrane protein (DUF2079)